MVLMACTDDPNTIETVTNETERGAILRTQELINGEFEINDLESLFHVVLEEQDILEGELLEEVGVTLSFIDNSPENGNQSVLASHFESLSSSDFRIGDNNLPVIDLIYSFQNLLDAVSLNQSEVRCKDQFRLDLDLILKDGRVFNTSNSGSAIVNDSGFFLSPFSYSINIVEPISSDTYLGEYFMEQIEIGSKGPTFIVENSLVELSQGHSNNVRVINFINEFVGIVELDVSIVCDVAVARRYQKTVLLGCSPPDPSNVILLGPDNPPGLASSEDDSVFELYILEGFEGFNTGCDFTDIPAKFRFSKQ